MFSHRSADVSLWKQSRREGGCSRELWFPSDHWRSALLMDTERGQTNVHTRPGNTAELVFRS